MISEDKILKEIRWLEKEVEKMDRPTRVGFKKVINEFETRLKSETEELAIPTFLRK